jgi:hypothetical protein
MEAVAILEVTMAVAAVAVQLALEQMELQSLVATVVQEHLHHYQVQQ